MKYLETPYPREWNLPPTYIFKISSIIGVFVFIFLYLFKPNDLIGTTKAFGLGSCLFYGGVSILIPGITMVLAPKLFPSYCKEEDWNIKKEFTLNIVVIFLIAVLVNIYGVLFLEIPFDWLKILRILTLVMIVSVVPILGIIALNQNRWLKKNITSSNEINQSILNTAKQSSKQQIRVKGQGKKEEIVLEIDNLLYINSQGNYCEIVSLFNEQINKTLIRISIASLEEQLKKCGNIIKVHRSYLVNLDNVKNVYGNAQGYRLRFDKTKVVVPVARSKSKEVKRRLII